MLLENVSFTSQPISTYLSSVQVIKTWNKGDRTIEVSVENNKVYYKVRHHKLEIMIPPYDVSGISTYISLKDLPAFLLSAQARLVPLDQSYKLYIQAGLNGGGNIITDPRKLWPGNRVPYVIDEKVYPVHSKARQMILDALTTWNQADTGLHFLPRTIQADALIFGINEQILPTQIGYQGGEQYISCLPQDDPLTKASVMREIGCAIGLYPEYQRWDRGDHTKHVNSDINIGDKLPQEHAFGEYDDNSIMQHPIKNGHENNQQKSITQNIGVEGTEERDTPVTLSVGDIAAVKHLCQLQHSCTSSEDIALSIVPPPPLTRDKRFFGPRSATFINFVANDIENDPDPELSSVSIINSSIPPDSTRSSSRPAARRSVHFDPNIVETITPRPRPRRRIRSPLFLASVFAQVVSTPCEAASSPPAELLNPTQQEVSSTHSNAPVAKRGFDEFDEIFPDKRTKEGREE